jgi:katanin p60 ATPase-containing subunit A1
LGLPKLLKALPFAPNSEFYDLAGIVAREIYVENPNVKFDDICGLNEVKKLVKEALVFPIKFPGYVMDIYFMNFEVLC